MNSPCIFLLDDDPLIRHAAYHLLAFRYPCLLTTDSPAILLNWVAQIRPELVITDACVPGTNGLSVLRSVRQLSASTNVVFLTAFRDLAYLREAIRLGLSGYVLKQQASAELDLAMQSILAGKCYVSPLLYRPFEAPSRRTSSAVRHEDIRRLTKQQFCNEEIARILNLSVDTIAGYQKSPLSSRNV